MASRRKGRELALQMLFQWELGEHTPQHVIASFLRLQRCEPEEEGFARSLFEGAVSEVASLDRMIQEHAEHWRLERMAAVDRNVIRLALYELLHCATPPPVIINEALELARTFSGEEPVPLINGVLDSVRKSLGRD